MGVLGSEGLVEAYVSAVEELKRDKETLLAAAALLELGAVQFHQQDTRWVPFVQLPASESACGVVYRPHCAV